MIKSYNILHKSLLLTASLLTLFFAFPYAATAVSIENPADTLKKGSFSTGVEVDLSSREIKFSDTEMTENSRQYLMKGGYGLLDWATLYGTVGAAKLYDDNGFDGDTDLAYGGGVKVRFYQYEDIFVLGLTGQFLRFTSQDDNVSGISGFNFKSTWNQYDLAVGASTKISLSNFYAGGLLSIVDGELKTPTTTAHFKESHPYGVFLGGDAELIENLRLALEARLIDETTVSFKLTYAFGGPKQGAEKK